MLGITAQEILQFVTLSVAMGCCMLLKKNVMTKILSMMMDVQTVSKILVSHALEQLLSLQMNAIQHVGMASEPVMRSVMTVVCQ